VVPKRIEMWRRHARHYVGVLGDLSSAYDEGKITDAITAFDLEWGQIGVARQRILSEPEVDEDSTLAFRIVVLGNKLIRLRRPASELVEGAETVLPFAKRLGPVFYADLLMNIGALALETAEPLRARESFTDGVEIVRANYADLDPKEADSLLSKGLKFLGAIEQQLGNDPAAMQYYEEALTVARRAGDEEQEGQIQGNIAVLMSEAGDNESAVAGYRRAIAVANRYGDTGHMERWTGNLANALSDLQRYAEAKAAAQEALSLARELGDRRQEGRRLGVLANVTRKLGNPRLALEHQLSGYQIAVEFGDSFSQGAALSNLGQIYSDLAEFEQALVAYEQAAERMNQAGRPHLASRAADSAHYLRPYAALAAAAASAETGDPASTLAELAELLSEARASGRTELVSRCLSQIGHVQMLLGSLADALTILREAIELAPDGSELRTHEVMQLANVHHLAGKAATAERLYAWLVTQTGHAGDRTRGLALANLAAMAARRGERDQARNLYAEALDLLRADGGAEAEQVAAALAALE
jgi:tetratricopeptide (TPR) repeat protein